MNIECVVDKLKEAVLIAEKAVAKNSTLPILNNFLLDIKNKSLLIKTTNLEIGIEVEVPVKVNQEGRVVVNSSVFTSYLINLINQNKIQLLIEGDNLKIKTSTTESVIKINSSDDFPIIPQVLSKKGLIIPSFNLLDGFRKVMYAAAVSDIKPEIASIYIYQEHKKIFFVATDTFRLAEIFINSEKENNFEPLIIPIKNIHDIIKVFEKESGNISINIDKNQISLFTDFIHLTSRIIDGNYPDYRQIIPKNHSTEVVVKRSDLLNTLKINSLFTDNFKQVNFEIKTENNTIEISSLNQNIGENKSVIICSTIGDNLRVSFNVKYLLDYLNMVNDNEIKMLFSGDNKPLLIKNADQNINLIYLVMPIRQ